MTEALFRTLVELNFAAAAAIALVLLLRRPLRRHLGPHAAYLMWTIVPAAMLATFIPSRTVIATDRTIDLPGEVMPAAMAAAPAGAESGWLSGLVPVLAIVWAAGLFGMAYFLARRQDLFTADMASGKAGPAVVGFVHSRIVTPDDFLTRFSHGERWLILAHEKVHLERHDARINAVVALARCVCWFNPLVHVGAHKMRIDQELSCDAAVVERRPRARRAYAETLLKTQLATRSLPVGCYWPAGAQHPLTERIAMLARTPLSRRRRLAATAVVLALAGAGGLAAWAAQPGRAVPPGTIELTPADTASDVEMLVPIQPLGVDGRLRVEIYANPAPAEVDDEPTPQMVYRPSGVDRRPFPGRAFAKPDYPAESIRLHEEGAVTVDACVDSQGLIGSVELVKSSGSARLDEATVTGLKGAKLEPATREGRPVSVCGYVFTLVWALPADSTPAAPP